MSLSKASLYFSIDVPAESTYIMPMIAKHSRSLRVVELAKKVEEIYLPLYLNDEQDEKVRDPHIWLSPLRVKIMVKVISDELCRLNPTNEDIYKANAIDYINRLHQLHSSIINSLSNLPQRTFISYHPAFSYFAQDYNLNLVAIETNDQKVTAEKLKNVVDLAAEKKIKYVFCQDEIDDSQAKVIAEEIAGTVIKTSPLAANYLENMQAMTDKLAYALR